MDSALIQKHQIFFFKDQTVLISCKLVLSCLSFTGESWSFRFFISWWLSIQLSKDIHKETCPLTLRSQNRIFPSPGFKDSPMFNYPDNIHLPLTFCVPSSHANRFLFWVSAGFALEPRAGCRKGSALGYRHRHAAVSVCICMCLYPTWQPVPGGVQNLSGLWGISWPNATHQIYCEKFHIAHTQHFL